MQDGDLVQPERLLSWKAALERKLDELNSRVRPLLDEVEKTRHQLELVEGLLGLESGAEHDLSPRSERRSSTATNGTVPDAIAGILREAAEPLHISKLRERFLATGRTIPGKGTDANLISYIVRDPRFVRVSKGTYALDAGSTRPRPRRPKQRPKRKSRRR